MSRQAGQLCSQREGGGGSSAADADLAETQNDAAAGRGPAKVHLGTKAGEEQNLIQLVLYAGIDLPGNDAIADGLAIGIYHGFHEKRMLSTGTSRFSELSTS